MTMDKREWRAVGIGLAAAIIMMPVIGVSWAMPVLSYLAATATWLVWQD